MFSRAFELPSLCRLLNLNTLMEYNILLMFLPLNQRIFFSEIYENLDFFYLSVDHEEELCCHTKSKLRS